MNTHVLRRMLGVAIAVPLFLTCSTREKSTLCFLTSYTRTDGVVTESVTYVYEGSLLKSESRIAPGDTSVSVYSYDTGSNRVKSTTQSSTGNYTTNYTYDNESKLLSAITLGADWTLTFQYVYNVYGQLSQETKTYTTDTGTLEEVRTFSYPDIVTRNPAEVTVEISGIDTWRISLEYDDKIDPKRGFLFSIRAANNVVKETRRNNVTLDEETVTVSYQYNSEGYPVSATSSAGVSQTWTYDCREI